ncbi:MAG: ketopantoate reductase family protein [Candidatus Hodarchaeales archaeon]
MTVKRSNAGRIAVIGIGPSGGILGAHLCSNCPDREIIFVDHDPIHVRAIAEGGLRLKNKFTVKPHAILDSISKLVDYSPKVIIVAVKTPALPKVIEELKQLDPSNDTVFVSHQNGIGPEEELANEFGRDRVLRGVINYAGILKKPGLIKQTFFNPPNYIGSVNKETRELAVELAALFTSAGIITEAVDDINKYAWKKTILNAALAAFCAVTRFTMKELIDSGGADLVMRQTVIEGIKVAKKLGYDYGEGFLEESLEYLKKAGHHKPSMLVDVEKRYHTEIDYINGVISRTGEELGVPTPFNRDLTNLIKAIEKKNEVQTEQIMLGLTKLGLDISCLRCEVVENCIKGFKICPYSGNTLSRD